MEQREKRRFDGTALAGGIPTDRKRRAEEILLGAILREPMALHNYIARLSKPALENASNGLGDCFLEILSQFTTYGNYSASSVSHRTGKNIAMLASQDTDIDLEWAVDNWEFEYKRWAVTQAYSTSAAQFNDPLKSALDISNSVDQEMNRLAAKGEMQPSIGHEVFMAWGADKLAGKQVEYITKPFLPEMLEIVPSYGPGELWIIAARPGMGKTQYAVNTVLGFHDAGASGLLFSHEMMADSIFRRLLGARHGYNPKADWSMLDQKEIGAAISDTASIKDTCTIIDSAYHISEIESMAIAATYTKKIDYIFIDYLQLVLAAGKHTNRDSEVGSVADALMRLAKKLKVPVIALAQLSRANETRGGSKRPVLSDLRESGRIEQSAYGIIFLHRPEYYGITEDENGNSTKGIAEVITAKHRNGDVGTTLAEWNSIRGFRPRHTEDGFSTQFPAPAPTFQLTDYTAARPSQDQDIPF